MARVVADYIHPPFAPHKCTINTPFFYRSFDFHLCGALQAPCNPALAPIRVKPHQNLVPYEDFDPMQAHFTREIRELSVTRSKRYPKKGVRQSLFDYCLHFFTLRIH